MTTHLPKNHRFRAVYRFLAFAAGAYCILFGIIGLVRSSGQGFFEISNTNALGLRTNTAFATLSIIVGAVVMVAAVLGRNIDHRLNLIAGPGFLVIGILMMLLLNTTANFLNFGMSTCIVSFIVGLVLMASGLYTAEAEPDVAEREEQFRKSVLGDPHGHVWGGDPTRSYERERDTSAS